MSHRSATFPAVILFVFFLHACSKPVEVGQSEASVHTQAINRAVLEQLPFDNTRDFEDARRGLIASEAGLTITGANGKTIWRLPDYAFLEQEAPATVNPSLWRQSQLNLINGLFQVSERIYQVRGYDLSNMTVIEGDRGWIIVDPLTTKETAAAAMQLVEKQLGKRPISAILFTHSHIDHFGGVFGISSAEKIAAEQTRLIAPAHFMEEATSENIIAGVPMSRRSIFMYGLSLERSAVGHVGSGLGIAPALGAHGIIAPTESIDQTGQTLTIDGLEFEFQYTPHSEAPAEFTFYLPELKAFCGAELLSRTMHNIYTLRGAKVRDAHRWSGYIDETRRRYADTEVFFASHHWPLWGNADILEFFEVSRDTYRFIHDQTMRMAASGMTATEIADSIKLPPELDQHFYVRGYYGSLRHNSRAVYQFYLGFYDGNPANLNPLPPQQAAQKYLQAIGKEKLHSLAQEAYDQGEYRWAAELLNHAVFADPDDRKARDLLANSYEQMGYQAESGPWRDNYLTGARELRQGPAEHAVDLSQAVDLLREIPISKLLDSMAIRLNGERAAGENISIRLVFEDLNESYRLKVERGVLWHYLEAEGENAPEVDATIVLSHRLLVDMMAGKLAFTDILFSDEIRTEGKRLRLGAFFSLLDTPDANFAIVEP